MLFVLVFSGFLFIHFTLAMFLVESLRIYCFKNMYKSSSSSKTLIYVVCDFRERHDGNVLYCIVLVCVDWLISTKCPYMRFLSKFPVCPMYWIKHFCQWLHKLRKCWTAVLVLFYVVNSVCRSDMNAGQYFWQMGIFGSSCNTGGFLCSGGGCTQFNSKWTRMLLKLEVGGPLIWYDNLCSLIPPYMYLVNVLGLS